jgi:hypothetical protein
MEGTMQDPIFTAADVGCHADHSFGWDYVRDVMADLVNGTMPDEHPHLGEARLCACDLVKELRGPMPDDAGDEYDALDWLQRFTADGLVWVIDQDLLLIEQEDD